MKKLTISLCLAFAAMSMIFGQASAKRVSSPIISPAQENRIFSHSEAGVQFELPKGWKAKPDGEVITVSTADDSLQMVFWVPDENTFDAAVKDLDKELSKTIKNIKTTDKGTSDKHNGMPHYSQGGTGDVNGATIEWSVDVLAARKVVLILTFAAPGIAEKHADEAVQFISSIKKID